MKKHVTLPVMTFVALVVVGCGATQQVQHSSTEALQTTPVSDLKQSISAAAGSFSALTLEQIMADPDWIGRSPQSAAWHSTGRHVVYEQKREGQVIRDVFRLDIATGESVLLATEDKPRWMQSNHVFNKERTAVAWIYDNNVFAQRFEDSDIRQLTADTYQPFDLQFLNDGRIAYRVDNGFFAVSLESGLNQQLLSWHFADAPQAVDEPEDFIAREQQSLIRYTKVQRNNRQQRFENALKQRSRHAYATPEPYYFEKDHTLVEASLSPNGHYALIVTRKDTPSRASGDIMPNYIGEDGRIKTDKVRRRVADAKPVSHALWLVDLRGGLKRQLDYAVLPGFNEDVLAGVKTENAEADNASYETNRLPRDIALMSDWYWRQSPVQWHQSGQHLAVMLEAWDNKDRWLATVDLREAKLEPQHRLHDDAWVNYRFNQFGWFHLSARLYFLSEQSGYSHLYSIEPGKQAKPLTSGQFEVDEPVLTRNDEYVYFKANREHPGIYEIYRLSVATGEVERLTALRGMTDFRLSPDEQKLLLTHSSLTRPPELWVQDLRNSAQPRQVTNTVSDAFASLPWQSPQIISVSNGETAQPVYARLYLPDDWQNKQGLKAVVFNHGAGYLQNAHFGWSGYFREYMFHNLLTQQGYVVLDMDYRASAGYGRDWRTAIYRQMGTPELVDLRAGVDWLVNNVNVDRARVGTYGGSYGGFLTFMAMFNAPELFQAGAALRPVSDWAHYNTPYTSNILNTPEVDPIAYRRSSPIYHAEGLHKPLLINAPMIDSNVFFVDVVRLVQRLIELEKQNFETAIYPVESHGFVQPSSWLDEYRRIYKLFEENL